MENLPFWELEQTIEDLIEYTKEQNNEKGGKQQHSQPDYEAQTNRMMKQAQQNVKIPKIKIPK